MVKYKIMTDRSTEELILQAAQEVFVQKGKDGARMQEIADKAGINKALLHYYYRSKDKLFLAVFKQAFTSIIPRFEKLLFEEENFETIVRKFVDFYITLLMKNSFIPLFVMQEIQKNPEGLIEIIRNSGIDPRAFQMILKNKISAGNYKEVDPKSFVVNMLSMCIFPIAAQPLLQNIIFEGDSKAYTEFLEKRKKDVADLVINSIKQD